MTTNKVPQIRFKGFNGELEEKKLYEISSTIFDGTHQTPSYTESGIPFFSVENLISKSKNKFISNKDYIEATKNNKPEKNDILITRIGNIGFSQVVTWDYDFSIYVTLAVIKQSNIFNSFYLNYYMQSVKYQAEIISKSLLSAVPCKINMNELRNTNIVLPKSLTEQKKIGDYFQQLDKLIEQKEKKYQKLKQFKKAMLDKMFPKNGADTPEIRFKGFSGKWGEKKLGQLAKITTGSSNRQDSGLDGKYTFFDRSDDIRTSNIYLFDGEAVIVAGEGSDFVPKYFKGKFDLHQRTYAIMNFENGDSKFLFYYIHLFRKWFLNQAVGSTVKSLRLPMFQEMVIKYPRKEEQEKIGNYFQKLDNQIELQQKELEKLKNIKKASLAKMFV